MKLKNYGIKLLVYLCILESGLFIADIVIGGYSIAIYIYLLFGLSIVMANILGLFLMTKLDYPEIKSLKQLLPEQEDEIWINHFDETYLDEIKNLFSFKKWEIKKSNSNYYINARTKTSLKIQSIQILINIEKREDKYKVYIESKPAAWLVLSDEGMNYKNVKKIKELLLNQSKNA